MKSFLVQVRRRLIGIKQQNNHVHYCIILVEYFTACVLPLLHQLTEAHSVLKTHLKTVNTFSHTSTSPPSTSSTSTATLSITPADTQLRVVIVQCSMWPRYLHLHLFPSLRGCQEVEVLHIWASVSSESRVGTFFPDDCNIVIA